MKTIGAGLVLALALAGCASQTTTLTSATIPPKPVEIGANELLIDTASCWFGGMWGDVEGDTPVERAVSSKERCESVVRTVFGPRASDRFVQLRAHEPTTMAELRATIERLADRSAVDAPRKESLLRLFDAIDRADYETLLARRAAHRIVRDAARDDAKLVETETAAIPALESAVAFGVLERASRTGDLQKEARTLLLLVGLDRMQIAEQLPVRYKPYVVAKPFEVLFGVPAPVMPLEPTALLPSGEWLMYLEQTAAAAHHPIQGDGKTSIARHEEAIAGILRGFADQLRDAQAGLDEDTPLPRLSVLMIRALEQSQDRAL